MLLIAYDRIMMTLTTLVLFSWNFQRNAHILHTQINNESDKVALCIRTTLLSIRILRHFSTISHSVFCSCFIVVVEIKVRWMQIKISVSYGNMCMLFCIIVKCFVLVDGKHLAVWLYFMVPWKITKFDESLTSKEGLSNA